MVLGCAFMVFSGVIVLVDFKEVGFALSLSLLCGGGCWREGMGADYWKPHKPAPGELKASRGL